MAVHTIEIKNISGSQVIEIPHHFKIDDDKVYLKKMGDTIHIIPFHNPWQSMVDAVDQFTEDFMEERNQPTQAQISRETFD